MATKRPHRWRRRVVAAVLVITAAVGTAVVLRRDDDAPAADAPATVDDAALFKTAEVISGDLTTSERVDGTVVRAETLDVVHRIEGQNGVTSAPQSQSNSNDSPQLPQGLRSLAASAVEIAPADDPVESSTPDSSEPATTAPDTSTPPDNSVPPDSSVPPDTSTPPVTTTPTRPGGGGSLPSNGPVSGGSGNSGGNGTTAAQVSQMVTSVIADGSVVALGDVLYTVDSNPVVALRGTLPAWRTMARGDDPGNDIRQLEESLVALGYDPEGEVVVDGEFDRATKAMVERWQTGLGVEATGEVTLGSVAFVPTDTAVTSVEVAVGDEIEDGDVVLTLADDRTEVVIDVPDGAEALFAPGVTVQLGGDVTGTVSELRSIERDDEVIVQAVIAPGSGFDAAAGQTVKVTASHVDARNVLLVPSEALLSRLDGTYSLQVQQPDGSRTFVAVELVGISGSQAGVRSDGLSAGSVVLQPA